MAASRSSRVTRSSVGINGLDENFCVRTLRNRSIAQPEEISLPPVPRARSPKKKQDCLQHEQPGAPPAKLAEGETLPVCGKRGLPSSEKSEADKDCHHQRAGAGTECSPTHKRAKPCPHSGESHGVNEEPNYSNTTSLKENEATKQDIPSSLLLGLGHEAQTTANQIILQPQTSNGLVELPKKDSQSPASPSECHPSILNGSQAAPSSSDSFVPCRSPHPNYTNEASWLQVDRERNCLLEEVAEAVVYQEPEMEVEVDVVGEVGQAQGEVPNGGFETVKPDDDNCSNISGETDATAAPQLLAEPLTFTEPQEHRYTLRTSPRRAFCASSLKGSFLHSDNGSVKVDPSLVPFFFEDSSYEDPSHDALGLYKKAEVEFLEDAAVCGEVKVSDRYTKELKNAQTEEFEEEEEDPDVYYFESDHLALKHNKDYQRLLQTISVLEAQRTQAILDLETLARKQKEALSNPISFVDQLHKQLDIGLPRPQRVVQLPDVAWDHYTSSSGDFEREFCDKKPQTRHLQLIFDKVGLPAPPKSPVNAKKESDSASVFSSSLPSSDFPEHSISTSRAQIIRGRLCDQNKPETFNQLWTIDEQKKLEQLLFKFPPEEIESKRWQKIADELGNRTAKQVASRVQKYFIKLTKAGIPVPGRTPNICMYSKKASNKRQHHLNRHLYRPSTFLTSYEPPVYMDDDEERAHFFSTLQENSADDSDDDGVPVGLRHLPEYRELLELKKLKKLKLHQLQAESALTQHAGYKCDKCGMEPIQGVRWHCQDCPPESAVDFCSSCSHCWFRTKIHKSSHRLEAVCQTESFLDKDYCLPQNTGYNYLDPNYFPANR